MCIICVDIQKEKMTSLEARRNLNEMYKALPNEHILDVLKLIWKLEDEAYKNEEEDIDEKVT
jgi:hypothetical protein